MLTPVRARAFKQDVKRAEKRGKDLNKLRALLGLLIHQQALPEHCRDHALKAIGLDFGMLTSNRTGC